LIVGTGGAGWVPFSNPGELHVVLVEDRWRVPVATGGSDLSGTILSAHDAVVLALNKGIMQEPRPFPLSFTGKHLFGSLTVSGQMVFFGTASVRFPIDMFEMNGLQGVIGGATYAIDLGLITSSVTGDSLNPFGGYNLANFGGGVAVFNAGPSDNYVIGLEVSKITSTHLTADSHPSPRGNLGFTAQGNIIYRLKSWLMRFLNL
jgi:type IV pilus assembly protein PilY1